MARYNVRGPDGTVHVVEGPDGASPADIEAFAASSIPKAAAAPKDTMAAPDPSAGGSTLNLAGFDTGIKTPQWLDRGLSGAGMSVANTGRGIGQMLGIVPQSEVEDAKARDKPLADSTAGQVGNVAGTVAQMAVPLSALGKAAPVVAAATKARPFATAAVTGGAFGATQPVSSENVLGLDYGRLGNTVSDAATSLLGQGVASGVGRLAKGASDLIAPEVKALYDKAVAAGIPVSAAQLSDSTFVKTLQSALSKLPFSGAKTAQAQQQGAFNTAVSRTFGENSPRVDNELYAMAKDRIGGSFNDLSARNSLNVTPTLANDLGSVSSAATKFGTSDTARTVGNAIDEIMSKADPVTGKIPGAAYQSFDSAMGKLTRGGDEKAHYIGQVRDAVRAAMDDSISPTDQAAWQTARSQYAALKTVRDLVAKDTGAGDISPAALMGRVTANNAGKERMAMGNGGDLGDLAQIGKRFLRDPIPDSGTAQRNMLYSMLMGGGSAGASMLGATPTQIGLSLGSAAVGTGIGSIGSRLLNSNAAARYAVNGAGPMANRLAYLARPAPYLLPAALNASE